MQYESVNYRKPYFDSDLEEIDFVSHMYPPFSDLDAFIAEADEARKFRVF